VKACRRRKRFGQEGCFSKKPCNRSLVLTKALYNLIVANVLANDASTHRYIPELKRNLISLGALEKEGYTIILQSGKVKVINCSRVILSRIRMDNCVYSLDGHAMAGELNVSVEEKDSLAQLVENQTGRTVKKLRTDNGLEFCNREFEQLCIESGISRHLTDTGTPQQNKVAERMNRTLMDKVRCLLIQYGFPKTFWAEATCTAAYLINRSPSRAIEKKTPIEMWSGHPSDYGILRIFGCVALYRLDDESPKIVTSENVVFNESVMYKDTLKDSSTDQEDVDDEAVADQATDPPPKLTDYQLAYNRELRTRTKPLRFRDESNMAAYAFIVAEEEDTHET
nr:copia LTR rider [Tanacetum cinerariifolium]